MMKCPECGDALQDNGLMAWCVRPDGIHSNAHVFNVIEKRKRSHTMNAQVTYTGCLDMQVCVPDDWTDDQVKDFADVENPCGTENGWQIRTDEKLLLGKPYRNPCADRSGFVHVMLDA